MYYLYIPLCKSMWSAFIFQLLDEYFNRACCL